MLLSHVQLYGFQARLRSFGEAKKLNNGGQTLQASHASHLLDRERNAEAQREMIYVSGGWVRRLLLDRRLPGSYRQTNQRWTLAA